VGLGARLQELQSGVSGKRSKKNGIGNSDAVKLIT
jgi:hypothetical protein